MTAYLLNLLIFTVGVIVAVFIIAGIFVACEKLFGKAGRDASAGKTPTRAGAE